MIEVAHEPGSQVMNKDPGKVPSMISAFAEMVAVDLEEALSRHSSQMG